MLKIECFTWHCDGYVIYSIRSIYILLIYTYLYNIWIYESVNFKYLKKLNSQIIGEIFKLSKNMDSIINFAFLEDILTLQKIY